ncbi:MAG: hypothetical protein ABIA37_02995 [Candidatus Woesearchaeota archaeon]
MVNKLLLNLEIQLKGLLKRLEGYHEKFSLHPEIKKGFHKIETNLIIAQEKLKARDYNFVVNNIDEIGRDIKALYDPTLSTESKGELMDFGKKAAELVTESNKLKQMTSIALAVRTEVIEQKFAELEVLLKERKQIAIMAKAAILVKMIDDFNKKIKLALNYLQEVKKTLEGEEGLLNVFSGLFENMRFIYDRIRELSEDRPELKGAEIELKDKWNEIINLLRTPLEKLAKEQGLFVVSMRYKGAVEGIQLK